MEALVLPFGYLWLPVGIGNIPTGINGLRKSQILTWLRTNKLKVKRMLISRTFKFTHQKSQQTQDDACCT